MDDDHHLRVRLEALAHEVYLGASLDEPATLPLEAAAELAGASASEVMAAKLTGLGQLLAGRRPSADGVLRLLDSRLDRETTPALSVNQPYAGLLAAVPPGCAVGLKSAELRSWAPPGYVVDHGVPVLIVATRDPDARAMAEVLPRVPERYRPLLEVRGAALGFARFTAPLDPSSPLTWARTWIPGEAPVGTAAAGLRAWPVCWFAPAQRHVRVRGAQRIYRVGREVVLDVLGLGGVR